MTDHRNPDRPPVPPQAQQKHPDEWERDLNPNRLAGQNIGEPSERIIEAERTAFHLRRAGYELRGDDEELKQVPVLATGTRLQQGATYVDLRESPPREFKARADEAALPGNAYVPKDRVPYEIWNRLIGEEKPPQR
jgi:CRISPR/Cas system endoribonuclease Cas6 (RAMP superfamily)